MKKLRTEEWSPLDISEQDVIEAMKAVPGYIDITPGDFKEVYQAAYALALKRLFNTLTAEGIMTRSVLVIDQTMSLSRAAALLAEKQVSGAPVIDADGRIVGVVSEKDFLREMGVGARPSFMQIATKCMNNESCMIGRLQNKTITTIMSKPPITGTPEMTIGKISSLFADRLINRLPIVDDDQRPVGIVTRTDLAHSFNVYGDTRKA